MLLTIFLSTIFSYSIAFLRFLGIVLAHSSFVEERYFSRKKQPSNSVCKVGETLFWKKINAEFSLQSASHNSRVNHQQQSWSQIREL